MDRKKFFKRKSTVGFIFLGLVLIGMTIGITVNIMLNGNSPINNTNYTFETIDGETIDLADHQDEVVIYISTF
ncbi:hypothetical protein LCGC14_2695850 [marine sediment metagenome]|uniref:Uncharacterized protein n=1 Tax=marine sediment metagenome TaxID=412755 RepID=A0A0F9BRM5_9ZZZZ